MVAYTVEGSNKVFSTWTDAKNHAASVVSRRKTDSKVSIKRNGEPYGEMWRQNGKIKYTTPCKPHTMAIPDSKKAPAKRKAPAAAPVKTVPKTAQKATVKKAAPKKRTETPVKATKTVKAVSTPKPKPKTLAEPKSAPKKSKPKAIESPKAVREREIPALPEPRREVRERRYEPAPELLGPGAQRRDKSIRSAAPALSFPALSWDEGKARHEANRARREERRSESEIACEKRAQAREDRKFARQQRHAEREMRRHIYVDEPDDPDGARARSRGDDGRRRAGEGTAREVVRARAPYNTYDAPEEIEAPKERRVVPVRSGTRQLPPPRSETTTATGEDGQTYEVEIIQPKGDRRRTRCPTAATAPPRWAWRPPPSPTSAGCSWRRWRARRTPLSRSTRASARRYSRERSCASATDMDGGSPTAPTAPSSRTDPWSGATDQASPSPKPLPNPLRSPSGAIPKRTRICIPYPPWAVHPAPGRRPRPTI